jgi:hypothetical protein
MAKEKITFDDLQTVKNYADSFGLTAAYIYKLEKEGKMELFKVDGVKFVPTNIYKSIPVINRRK